MQRRKTIALIIAFLYGSSLIAIKNKWMKQKSVGTELRTQNVK